MFMLCWLITIIMIIAKYTYSYIVIQYIVIYLFYLLEQSLFYVVKLDNC